MTDRTITTAGGVESGWGVAATPHGRARNFGKRRVLRTLRLIPSQQLELGHAVLRRAADFVRDLIRQQLSAYLAYFAASKVLMMGTVCLVVAPTLVQVHRVSRKPDRANDDEACPHERELTDATALLLRQAEYELTENTADAWLDRMALPQVVFDALDAYLSAFGPPTTREAEAEHGWRRNAWLRRAMDNWQLSKDYRDDAGYPMASLREGQRVARTRLLDALSDPERGEDVARDLAEMSRLEWAMAIARGPADAPHTGILPPVLVQAALDDYFADGACRHLDGSVPSYPDLHLVSETVVRASIADYCPECPDPLQWCSGLPAPIKAALDALG